MSSTQEPIDNHFKDCYVASQFAYFSDGREYAWYLPYGERLYFKCKQSSTDYTRLLLGAQQEFCLAADVDTDIILTPRGMLFERLRLTPLTYTPYSDGPRILRPRADGRALVPEGVSVTIPARDAANYESLAVALADQQDMGFAAAADSKMSLSTMTHTSADGQLKKSGKDRYSRPDFVSYFTKPTRGRSPAVDNLTPWLITELKPPKDPLYILDFDGFGRLACDSATLEIRKTIPQALDQARHGFSEYPNLRKFAVLIGCGPFFDLFFVFRPRRSQTDQNLYLSSIETRKRIDHLKVEAKPLFSDDKKSFHPAFDRLWDLALQEFRL